MAAAHGILSDRSPYSVPDTLDRLESFLRSKGIKIFARIDHSGEAAQAGLTMPPTQLLIFGNPKSGTPIMLAAPLAAIDLPLKALAWEDQDGAVWVGYNDPAQFRERFGLAEELLQPVAMVGTLIRAALSIRS
ncbi:MAG: DUF302 domain-containing protein [Bryobacteraceae bacterium]|jgi:uncharacterized protein (DUF302 family)